MRISITRYVGLMLTLATLGALLAVVDFCWFLAQSEHDGESFHLVGRQATLAEEVYLQTFALANGQSPPHHDLRLLMRTFDVSLEVLDRGGDLNGETIPAPPMELSAVIHRLVTVWIQLQPPLHVLTDQPSGSPAARKAFAVALPRLERLKSAPQEIYRAFVERAQKLRHDVLWTLCGLSAFDLLLLGLVVWRMKFHVAFQIQKIAEGVRRVEGGNFAEPIPVVLSTQNELTRLAAAFNEMAAGVSRLIGLVKAEQRHNQEILASVPSGLAVFSADLHMLEANHSFTLMFSVPKSTEEPLSSILPITGLEDMARYALEGDLSQAGTFSDVPGVGGPRFLRVTFTPIHHLEALRGAQDEGRLLLVVDDLTEIERLRNSAQFSEKRWRNLVEGIDAIVWEAEGATLRPTYVNRRAEQILGYPTARWLYDDGFLMSHVHEDDRERVESLYRSALAGGDKLEFEYRARSIDSREVWLRNFLQVVREVGKAPQVRGIMVDITQSKRAEEALRNREERLIDFFENSQGFLYTHDLKGRLLSVNPATARTLGYSPEEMIGNNLEEFLATSSRHRFAEYLDRLSVEAGVRGIMRFLTRAGEKRVWLYHNSRYQEEGSEPYARCQALDITERQLAQEALRAKTDQLQTITEAMSAFLRSGDWREASTLLLRSALRQTMSNCGVTAVVVDGPALRLLAFQGFDLDDSRQDLYSEIGYLDLPDLTIMPGRVLETAQVVMRNDLGPSDLLVQGGPELRNFMGVPIFKGKEIVGIIGVANRPGTYGPSEQAQLEVLARTAAVLFDSYGRMQRENVLQDQLRMAQKMEAIGRLAGGIAHDFNNLLTGINGYSELLLHQIDPASPLREDIEEIKNAGERAASLTRQLLAFSRRQVMEPKVLDLNANIFNLEKILRRLMGDDVKLSILTDDTLGQVKADPGQVEQILLNLVMNARDAMPEGGKVTIETHNAVLDEAYARTHPSVQPGDPCMIAVSDTGCGIDALTMSHVFEPFFTTKAAGKGTGLGLATVYGIVKQSGGYVWVYSELEKGTTFRVYLPRVDEAMSLDVPLPKIEQSPSGTETILVAEDEGLVRELVHKVLLACGYRVLLAGDGAEALSICQEYEEPIHLLITDVVMPGMGGRELNRLAAPLRPEMRVLYTSGYTDVAIINHGILDVGAAFLQKPFSNEALMRKVREMLDEERPRKALPPPSPTWGDPEDEIPRKSLARDSASS